MITHIFHRIRFAILKRRIRRNPYLGSKDSSGAYDYKQGGYGISYRIAKSPSGKECIDWISQRRRIYARGEGAKKLGNRIFKFWHYQGWLIFFRPPVVFLLIISLLLFYFGIVERQEAKIKRFRWLVASLAGVSPQQVEYIGNGWLEISAQRKTAVDRISEPVRYTVNFLDWFFSSHLGFANRWRGEPYGYVTSAVVYNEKGEVWIKKEGVWQHGTLGAGSIKWDIPQGTGIRAGKVLGHEKSVQDKKLYIRDK